MILNTKLNKMGYTRVYFSSHSSGRCRGVTILIHKKIKFEYITGHKDNNGRYIMIIGNI